MKQAIVYLKEYKAVFPHRNKDKNPSRFRVMRILGTNGKQAKEIEGLSILSSLSLDQVVRLNNRRFVVKMMKNKQRSSL